MEKKKETCPYCGKLFDYIAGHEECLIRKSCEGFKKLNLSGFVPDRRRKGVKSIKDIILREQLFGTYGNDPEISYLITSDVNISVDKLINLQELTITYRPTITEINGLENLTKLEELVLCQNAIPEINGLGGLTNLESLNLWHNQITNIKGLETLTNLQRLKLDNNQIIEIKGLDTLTNLQILYLGYNQITELKGLDNLTNLKSLYLDHNQIKEMKGLDPLTNLKTLDLSYNTISEIKGLETITSLEALNLAYNQIEEIKGLETLTNLQKLDLSNNFYINEIKGFDNLQKLQELNLNGTNIPPSLIEHLGGLDKEGKANDPQRFVEYSKLKKQEELNEKNRKKPRSQEEREISETKKEEEMVKINEIDTTALLNFLLQELKALDNIRSRGYFEEKEPPTGEIITERIGPWLWIKARLVYEGATFDYSTDRASGDPYEAHVWRDWVGPIESALTIVSRPEDLEEWSLMRTTYLCEYTDVGIWGTHNGSYVDKVLEDGTVIMRIAGEDFHDVFPESKTTVQYVQLKKIKKQN